MCYFREDASVCQTALIESNIFIALETIQAVLLGYERSEKGPSQTVSTPLENSSTGPDTVALSHFLDAWSKAGPPPGIKQEVSESVPTPQPDCFYVNLLDSFKSDKNTEEIQDGHNGAQPVSAHGMVPQHEGNENDCKDEVESDTTGGTPIRKSKRKNKGTYKKKAMTKSPQKVTKNAGKRNFKCNECARNFKRRQHLERHYKTVHNKTEETGEFVCTVYTCQAVFDRQSKLDQHMAQVPVITPPPFMPPSHCSYLPPSLDFILHCSPN